LLWIHHPPRRTHCGIAVTTGTSQRVAIGVVEDVQGVDLPGSQLVGGLSLGKRRLDRRSIVRQGWLLLTSFAVALAHDFFLSGAQSWGSVLGATKIPSRLERLQFSQCFCQSWGFSPRLKNPRVFASLGGGGTPKTEEIPVFLQSWGFCCC